MHLQTSSLLDPLTINYEERYQRQPPHLQDYHQSSATPEQQQHSTAMRVTHTSEHGMKIIDGPINPGVVPFNELHNVKFRPQGSQYKCPLCPKEFSDKNNFRHHYMIHSGEKPYACKYCPYRARQVGNLNMHIRFKHFKHINAVE